MNSSSTPALALVILALATCLTPVAAEPPSRADDAERLAGWRADVQLLVETLPKKHAKPFTVVARDKFEAAAKDLAGRLDGLSDWQIQIELRRLLALIGDAHTMLGDPKNRYPRRQYPFFAVLLEDGVFVAATTEAQRALLGARLLKIEGADADTALRRIAEIIGHENESWRRAQSGPWLNHPEALAALGLIKNMDAARFTFRTTQGKEISVTLAPMAKADRFTAILPKLDDLPPSRKRRPFPYGALTLPDSRDLYVWYDQCADRKELSVADFAKKVLAAIDRDKPDRVIIDLRRNSGGNSGLIRPLVAGLAQRTALQGKLFALIGRETFSSGLWAAIDLKTQAKAVLVGEPTGGKPNSFGEQRSFDLPNSGLTVFYSTRLWKRLPGADPVSLMPDVPAPQASADFFAPRDRAIEEVRGFKGGR